MNHPTKQLLWIFPCAMYTKRFISNTFAQLMLIAKHQVNFPQIKKMESSEKIYDSSKNHMTHCPHYCMR